MSEYRSDDQTVGYCPKCGSRLSTLNIDAIGYCGLHGWVAADWEPVVTVRVVDKATGEDVPMVSGPAVSWEWKP